MSTTSGTFAAASRRRSSMRRSCSIAHRRFDGRRLAFDMRQHRTHLRQLPANLFLQPMDKAMRLQQWHRFLHLDVLLHVQPIRKGLDAHIVQQRVVARGHRPHLIEQTLRHRRSRHGMDHHVRVRQHPLHRRRRFAHQLLGALKRQLPRQRQRHIGKIVAARSPHPRLVDPQHAIASAAPLPASSCAAPEKLRRSARPPPATPASIQTPESSPRPPAPPRDRHSGATPRAPPCPATTRPALRSPRRSPRYPTRSAARPPPAPRFRSRRATLLS